MEGGTQWPLLVDGQAVCNSLCCDKACACFPAVWGSFGYVPGRVIMFPEVGLRTAPSGSCYVHYFWEGLVAPHLCRE